MKTEFYLKLFNQHKAKGIIAKRSNKPEEARYNFLKAAEYLFKLAGFSRGKLRESRIKNAQKLVQLAKNIGEKASTDSGASGADGSKTVGSKWVVEDRPSVRFSDVAGLEEVKDEITRRVIYPFTHPEATERFKKKAGGGVLLYGPPGTGKTMIAMAVAGEVDATFFSVRCSDIMSKWVGEAEQNLKTLFEQARSRPRSVVFLDEAEAIISKRGKGSTVMDRVIPEFLSQVDGFDSKDACILLLGATNRPWDLDNAALRAGRFGKRIYIGLPDKEARLAILAKKLEGVPVADDIDLERIADKLEGFSGADIAGSQGLIDAATDFPYRREIDTGEESVLEMADLVTALEQMRPSVSPQMLKKYRIFDQRQ